MQTFERRGEPIAETHYKSVQRLALSHRPRVEAESTGGIRLNGTIGAFQQLADSLWFQAALDRY